jgi:hypothetical protein
MVPVTEWEPATETEAAMRDALRANDQELYFRILARTELLLPVPAGAPAGDLAGWGTWTTAGRTHVLAFTSTVALEACLADNAGASRRVAYQELAGGWPNNDWWLAVNPGLPIEGYLPAWFVAQLVRGEVRLPGRGMGARARLERAESVARARAATTPYGPGPERGPTPVGPPVIPGPTGPYDDLVDDADEGWPYQQPTERLDPRRANGGRPGERFRSARPYPRDVAAEPTDDAGTPMDTAYSTWYVSDRSSWEGPRRSGEPKPMIIEGTAIVNDDPPPGDPYRRPVSPGPLGAYDSPGEPKVVYAERLDEPKRVNGRPGITPPPEPEDPVFEESPTVVRANRPGHGDGVSDITAALGARRTVSAARPGSSTPDGGPTPTLPVTDPREDRSTVGAADAASPAPPTVDPLVGADRVTPAPGVDLSPGTSYDPDPMETVRAGYAAGPAETLDARYGADLTTTYDPDPTVTAGYDADPATRPVHDPPSDTVAPSVLAEPTHPLPPVTAGPAAAPADAGPAYAAPADTGPAYAAPADTGPAYAAPADPVAVDLPGYDPEPAGLDPVPQDRLFDLSPEFVPEDYRTANDTEASLLEAARAGSTDSLLSTLLLAKVLLPVEPTSRPGALPGDPGFSWRTDRHGDGTVVTVFTSQERLAEHTAEPIDTVSVKFVHMIRRWPDDEWSVAVDPGTPIGAKLPGSEVVTLANMARELGLGDDAPASEPAVEPAPDPGPRLSRPVSRPDPTRPTVMQKTIAPSQVSYYLERGYDRVSGFVNRASELAHLRTPAALYAALGLGYPGSPFTPEAEEVYVLRWPAYRPMLYRVPFGGQTEEAMRAMEGWVVERAPFRGNGFAPGEGSDLIAEFKVDSARLPHGAELWRIGADGTERLVAMLDSDATAWRKVDHGDP